MKLSQRCHLLEPSPTMAINNLAKELAKSGRAIFNLSVGEPDFNTPDLVKAKAIEAITTNQSKYTAAGGTQELKTAIQQKYIIEFNFTYQLNSITCANGGKQILYNLFQVLLDADDEVIVFSPYWVSYKTQVELAGGKLIEVNLSPKNNFSFDIDLLSQAITPKTKAILLNSPSNPTGQILTKENIEAIADLARKHEIIIISDDVYESIYFSQHKPTHLLNAATDLSDKLIIVNAVSKTYAMTGWRLGYALGPVEIISKMEEFQSHSASNPSSISQAAAVAALSGLQDGVEKMRLAFLERRSAIITQLDNLIANGSELSYIKPDGAFYLMLNITTKKQAEETDLAFCLDLLNRTGVAAVPGSSFGQSSEGYIRLSFATDPIIVSQAIDFISQFRS
ncbi:MAG: pyridoxal phosphate-dependent aminotransferase [Candidatus Falkowbacteria bacterium]